MSLLRGMVAIGSLSSKANNNNANYINNSHNIMMQK